jgi:hypothetical protein
MPRDHLSEPASEPVLRNRNELVANTAGLDISVGSASIRVANVPVYREIDNRLHQAVRLRLTPGNERTRANVRLSIGERELATIDLEIDAPATELLFVPEVDVPTEATVEVVGDRAQSHTFTIEPQRKWTIHLIHHSHYDIGYTDPQAEVMNHQLAFIDDALELATATDDWPDEAKFRWVIEVNWPLKHWLRTRSRAARDELARRVREGRIEINALPFSMHAEAYSYDELARQLDYARELRETLGVEITTAMQTDVPGSPIGLSSLLADAGVNFLAVAHNYAGRSIPHHLDGQDLTRPFFWETPDGQRVMVWYTDTLFGSAYMEAMNIGFGSGFDDVVSSLPEYLNAVTQRAYPYGSAGSWIMGSLEGVEQRRSGYPHDLLHLRVMGAFGDNGPSTILAAAIAREWNATYAWPKLVTSTNGRFRDEVAERIGDKLDTFRGDWTDWWADGIGSAANLLGKNRASQANIRTAQTLNAIATALGDPADPSVPAEIKTAYQEMALFDEHTWGAGNPWGTSVDGFNSGEAQWHRKAGFAYTAEERIGTILSGARERLGSLARTASECESLAVFNPTGLTRTDAVRMFIPAAGWPGDAAILHEADSGASIPITVEPQSHPSHRPQGVWITFVARDVPPFGYVRYRLGNGDRPISDHTPRLIGSRLETETAEIELDLTHGSIASITANGREIVDQSAATGFGGWIHDFYASGTGFNHLSSRIGRSDPWLLGSRGAGEYGHVISAVSNAVADRVTWRQSGQGADWIETTLTVPHDTGRIHLSHRLSKPSVMEKESGYIAFPFAGDDPQFSWEITGGIVRPGDPHVPGSAHWFRAIRHAALVETAGQPPLAWGTTQAPLIQVGNIHLPYAPFATTIPADRARPGTIYSWAFNNIWDTNFPPRQGGELRFDYVIGLGGKHVDPMALLRDTSASAAQPLVGIRARKGTAGNDLPDRGSFVESADLRVEITHLAAEPDGTLVVSLTSHAPESIIATLTFGALHVASAESATFLGEHRTAVAVNGTSLDVELRPGALQTVRLTLG